MTVVFSTSSPVTSVALFEDGSLLGARSELAPRAASGACLRLLEGLLTKSKRETRDVRLFVADTGPGSFTGVKVGVVLAKTLAFAVGAKTAGIVSFDLIDPKSPVVVPSKKGEWFYRNPGEAPTRSGQAPNSGHRGYGHEETEPRYPSAERAAGLLASLIPFEPEALLPTYFAEPSISSPKTPYRLAPN